MIVIKNVSDLSREEIKEALIIYYQTGESQIDGDILGRMQELWDELVEGVTITGLTINQLKKQIKHSKNPLEIKTLNKQLNLLYKRK